MGRKEQLVEKVVSLMDNRENIRNIGIVAHIDHGKTTMTDHLVAAAGMISEELAGEQRFLDADEIEQRRGITIDASNISLVHDYDGKSYLINLIDTPGHVDFGGNVTRAMRAVDGGVIVVCAVEGCMPQTETVLRQALKERVKPVVFINKVDRLIKELQLTPEQMQQRFVKIIAKVNKLISKFAPPELKKKWQVRVEDGSVCLGSAYHNWAVSMPAMKRTGITFKDVYDYMAKQKQKELSNMSPLHEAMFEMIITKLPNPLEAQKYRIARIWKGDLESDIGKSMVGCDSKGKLAIMVTDITVDPHAGYVATGRVYSGTVVKGRLVNLINAVSTGTVQQVCLYMGLDRVLVENVPAGNIVAIVGLRDAFAGETVCEEKIMPFEAIKHYSEPVMTKSIEAKNPKDLPKLVEALQQVAKEDPTIKIELNEETGEHLISGMGELHLEIVETRLQRDKHVQVRTSKPIVVYRESVTSKSPEVMGKSPNKHNKFFFTAEPLEEKVFNAIVDGTISEGRPKFPKELSAKLHELGMDTKESKRVWDVRNTSMLIDLTKGVQYLNETKELILDAFEQAINAGPLAKEKCIGIKVILHDATLHEDAVHRGPAQVYSAIKRPIYGAMLLAKAVLLEPKQKLFVSVPQEYMGGVTKEIQSRRGQIQNMEQEEDLTNVTSKVPIAEMFGFSSSIRSASQGRAMWSTEYSGYETVPAQLQTEIVKQIRTRKGLKPEPPSAQDFMER